MTDQITHEYTQEEGVMQQDMKDRVALVTGAGNGIGRAIALELAARGATVAVNDLKDEAVARTVNDIRAQSGRAIAVVRNVASREDIGEAVAQSHAEGGRFDILINNAAWVRYQAVPEILPETLDRMVDIGFKSVVWGIQAAADYIDPQRGGVIVNISSMVAMRSPKHTIVYSGVKAALLGITRAAAAELGPRKIRVNAVCPSAVPTEGTERMRDAARDAMRAARTPLGRLGTTDDIARVVGFLASDASGFVTAQTIVVDGGITATDLAP